VRAALRPQTGLLRELVADAAEAGVVRITDVRRATVLVQQTVMYSWFGNRLVEKPERTVDAEATWEFCLHGLGASPAPDVRGSARTGPIRGRAGQVRVSLCQRREQDRAVSSFPLGLVKRHIRPLDGHRGVVPFRMDGVTDAEGDERSLLTPSVEESVRDQFGTAAGRRVTDEEKFLSPVTSDRVSRARRCSQIVAELRQHGVTRLVPERVVDRLEMVEVEDEDRVTGPDIRDAFLGRSAVPDS